METKQKKVTIDLAEYWSQFEMSPNNGQIDLRQVDRRRFQLHSDIRYLGDTGLSLSAEDDEEIRNVGPGTLDITDLASVPAPFRWWASTYGEHTPAALIHDRFIGKPSGGPPRPPSITDQQIDTYFRLMLDESGVKFFRRWLMWAAVASRTRLVGGGFRMPLMFLWAVLASAGVIALAWGIVTGDSFLIAVALVSPVPAALCWGKQWGAGVIIAYFGIPLLLPPALLAVPLLLVFAVMEQTTSEVINQLREEFSSASPTDGQVR